MVLLLENDEASIAVPVQLSHQRPIGIKGVEHDGVDKGAVRFVQQIDETSRRSQFALMTGMLASGIAARLLIEHWFDADNDIDNRTQKQSDDIAMVVLIDLLDLACRTFYFDFAHQAVRAMPIIGRKGFPSIQGHATLCAI